jgi:hypothetical protein
MKCWFAMAAGQSEIDILSCALSDVAVHGALAIRTQIFPARAGGSPERMAGQTACPEEFSARARKVCGEPKSAGVVYTRGGYIFLAGCASCVRASKHSPHPSKTIAQRRERWNLELVFLAIQES